MKFKPKFDDIYIEGSIGLDISLSIYQKDIELSEKDE